MRAFVTILAVVALIGAAVPGETRAENPAPYSGTESFDTGAPFKPFVDAMPAAIKGNSFGVIGIACANCAIQSKFKETIPGNRVFLFFRPDYARRMLKASTAAGIEAPIRLYVTETPAGTAQVTYRLPSHVFGAYEVAELTAMGKELDTRVAAIIADATKTAK
ncbi:MAG: DUF302 domain-containing protein [Alphaproteobacteria bacterium]|nr:DUF302 domain-containing protein [Alphaproteobacteria bacterium]